MIRAQVLDDERVDWVWAVIYPPSYDAPEASEEWVEDALPTIVLRSSGDGWYAATYPGFDELGTYRVVIYARDDDGLEAQPVVINVRTESQVYLPAITR